MKITVKNLGPIKEAEMELLKPLTIFAGPNGTGKTYMAYLLHALYSKDDSDEFNELFQNLVPYTDKEDDQEITFGSKEVRTFLAEEVLRITKDLPSIFGMSRSEADNIFSQFSLSLDMGDAELEDRLDKAVCRQEVSAYDFKWEMIFKNRQVSIHILNRDWEHQAAAGHPEIPRDTYSRYFTYVRRLFLRNLCHRICYGVVGRCDMLTSERNSVHEFASDILYKRSNRVSAYQELEETDQGSQTEIGVPHYPQAVHENLIFAYEPGRQKTAGEEFILESRRLEDEMLRGNLEVDGANKVWLKIQNKMVPLQSCSSSAKALAPLVLYLRFMARSGDVLIMDEPEMNLHPDLQIKLAHAFVRLVNKGLKILVSTHSDYFLREFNNAIMAGRLSEGDKREVLSEADVDDNEAVKGENVGAWYFNFDSDDKVKVRSVAVETDGFTIDSVDDAIREQDRRGDLLFDAVS